MYIKNNLLKIIVICSSVYSQNMVTQENNVPDIQAIDLNFHILSKKNDVSFEKVESSGRALIFLHKNIDFFSQDFQENIFAIKRSNYFNDITKIVYFLETMKVSLEEKIKEIDKNADKNQLHINVFTKNKPQNYSLESDHASQFRKDLINQEYALFYLESKNDQVKKQLAKCKKFVVN